MADNFDVDVAAAAICPRCKAGNFPEYQADPAPAFWHDSSPCIASAIWIIERGEALDRERVQMNEWR